MIETLPLLEELVPHLRGSPFGGVLHCAGALLEGGPENDRRPGGHLGGHLVLLGREA